MSKESDELLAEIEKTIKTHKHKKEERNKAAKAKEQPVTKADMEALVNKMMGQPEVITGGKVVEKTQISNQPMQQPVQQQPQPTERQQVAYQIWKDQKTLSIICLIAIALPMISVFVTMGFGEMVALIISFAGLMYPLIMFVKSMTIQVRLQAKYGFKPLFQFQPRRPMQPIQQQPQQQKQQQNKEDEML